MTKIIKAPLIVIDMQEDFINGSLGSPLTQAVVLAVQRLTEKKEFDKIFYTKDTHTPDYMETLEGKKLQVPHCIKDTEGWEIIPELQEDGEIIEKPTFGSRELAHQVLHDYLNYKFEDPYGEFVIHICGVCTDICVVSNALMLRAYMPDVKIVVHANACAGTSVEAHNAALKVMQSCQIDIVED